MKANVYSNETIDFDSLAMVIATEQALSLNDMVTYFDDFKADRVSLVMAG